MMMLVLPLAKTSDGVDDAAAATFEARDAMRAERAAVVMVRLSSSMQAISDSAVALAAADAGAMDGGSMAARAALMAMTDPSMPKERANASMNMLRMRSFVTLTCSRASEEDGATGAAAEDCDDCDADGREGEGEGVLTISKSPSVMDVRDVKDG